MELERLGEWTVAEVLERWPQTIPVFLRHKMACVGCAMAPFETLAEVAVIYRLDVSRFLEELQARIQSKKEEA